MVVDHTTISDIVFSIFSKHPSEIEQIEMGVMTFKFRVKVDDCDYVVRIYPDENATDVEQEFAMMKNLFASNCKVPEPITFNTQNQRFLIYKFIDGEPLSKILPLLNDEEINSISDEIVKNLKQISLHKTEKFGFSFLVSQQFASWAAFMEEYRRRGDLYLRENKLFEEETIDAILNFVKKQIAFIQIEQPVFVWCDFSQGNIIVQEKRLAGFVDFEGCISGDPVMALGYLFAIEGNSKFFEAVVNSYRRFFEVSYERILFYAIIRLLRFSKYVNNPFPTGIKRDPVPEYFKGLPIAINYIKSIQ